MIAGTLTIGEFMLFITLLLQLVWPLEALGWIINLGQRAVASAGRSFAWLEGIEPLPEPADPQELPAGPLDVRFEDVHFSYGGADVLRGVDLAVEPGQIVALCGSTGAGKTTLLNLLPRFYDPTAGRVLIGGVDTRDTPGRGAPPRRRDRDAEARALLRAPAREPALGAARRRLGRRARARATRPGVAAFVDDLPHGYDTLIGERGVNLSGGQRQRVALARALLAGSRVLVLDDPMSAVDTETERLLVENLRPAVAGRTVLVATQRLSTIGVADVAVVLDEGRIVEQGTAAGAARAPAASSPPSSETSPLPRRPHRTGLSRLAPYAKDKKGRLVLIAVLAGLSAAAPVAGWHLVQDAIDNGIRAGDEQHLAKVVLAYIAVNAAAWGLGTATWLGLAGVGQRVVLELRRDLFQHLTSLSLRYFSQQKAGWIISRLTSDVDALSDVLNQGLTTLVVNTLTLVAAVAGLFLLDWRLGLVAMCVLPPGDPRHALVPEAHACRRRGGADEDRDRDRAARRVRRRHGRDPGLQPRARVPEGVRRPERGQPARERPRAEDLLRLLPGDRAARRDRDRRGALRGRALHRRRHAWRSGR